MKDNMTIGDACIIARSIKDPHPTAVKLRAIETLLHHQNSMKIYKNSLNKTAMWGIIEYLFNLVVKEETKIVDKNKD